MKRKGFTLIELLVVIAIIAILAAILFPVFARAREQARKASCESNLKQISTAILMYSEDFDENYPSVVFANYPNGLWGSSTWNSWGWSYLWPMWEPYIKNYQVYTCPSAPGGFNMAGPSNNRVSMCYAYSEYLYDHGRGWSKLAALAGSPHGVAGVAILADSRFPGIFNDWDGGGTGNGTAYPQSYLARAMLANGSSPRHDGSNFAFADGHVKFYPTNKIKCPQAGGWGGEDPVVNPQIN